MDNPWVAQKSKSKTLLRFRSGRPFLPITPLQVSPSLPTWALKSPIPHIPKMALEQDIASFAGSSLTCQYICTELIWCFDPPHSVCSGLDSTPLSRFIPLLAWTCFPHRSRLIKDNLNLLPDVIFHCCPTIPELLSASLCIFLNTTVSLINIHISAYPYNPNVSSAMPKSHNI